MKYFSTAEMAQIWGISANRISILAKEGRIHGAVQIGMRWLIPENSEKPADGRTKMVKTAKEEEVFFRFPLFVNFEEKDYSPKLSEEELILRHGQKAFHACRFEESKDFFLSLQRAKNRYVRLSALYHRLYISMYENSADYDNIYLALNRELLQDFPYRNEMMMLRYGFDADNTNYQSVLTEFGIDSEYTYHPSAYYTMLLVSFLPIENGDFSLMSKIRYETQEILCQKMEDEGYYLEAQKLHYLLAVVYQLQNNNSKVETHIRCGLNLAMMHELYFTAAFYERWYRNPTQKVLREFPLSFSKKIQAIGKFIQNRQAKFDGSGKNPSYMSVLSCSELEYAFLANQGYTNREIAQKQMISEKKVSRIYTNIYEKLNIKTKKELVNLINATHKFGKPVINAPNC